MLTALETLMSSSSKDSERPLDRTYDRVIETLCSQPQSYVDLGLLVLLWLVKAKRTLTVEELQTAISVEPGRYELDELDLPDKTTILDVCAGLVTIDEGLNSSTIRPMVPTFV